VNPESLGPYRIVRTLGKGGMGRVFQGVNAETGEPAAVKVLSASLSLDADFRQRFEGEIETLKKLRHPNIVRLFGFGEQDGILFYAMELVEGLSLEEELERGRRFHWREVAHIGIQTCRALRHAHDRGIIHRDIKPANLLLTSDSEVKLSDFGIARLFGDARMTAAGNVLGTVEYMAPEQADARPVGPRTDLYSLGGVMYALLVGRPPFRARSLAEMLDKQRSARLEPVTRYNLDVPAELDYIIRHLQEKAPEDRIATAMVLTRRLEAMLHALPDESETPLEESDNGDFQRPDSTDSSGQTPLPPTREVTQLGSAAPPTSVPPDSGERMVETRRTSAFAGYAEADKLDQKVMGPTRPTEEDTTSGHFVTVAEEELDKTEVEDGKHRVLISIQTGVLLAALIGVGVWVWYLLQPPSADELYQTIVDMTKDDTVSSYRRAEDDINDFLRLYSTDSRCEQLREYLNEIELDRLEKRLERGAKGQATTANVLPIEAAYLEALRYANLQPELGAEKFRALIDLYNHRRDLTGPTGFCVELARRKLQAIERQIDRHAPVFLTNIEDCLDRADAIEETDPERAHQMRKAVILFHGEKPWAATAVARAEKALKQEDDELDTTNAAEQK
jgi:serine/threonine-protein kinase